MRMSLAFVLLLFGATHAQAQMVYSVFFDWDRATVTDQGYQVIQQAAAAAHGGPYRVVVDGFTDTSGLTGYNQTLSMLRAQAVAAALERDGVPSAIISIRGFGENYLRIPTADQVREPQIEGSQSFFKQRWLWRRRRRRCLMLSRCPGVGMAVHAWVGMEVHGADMDVDIGADMGVDMAAIDERVK